MGNRLTRIYTRTGDSGTTTLGTGERVKKFDLRIAVAGTVDETNSALGIVLAEPIGDQRIRNCLIRIQNELFDLGAEVSTPGYTGIGPDHVARLEADLDELNDELPPLREFILPGGSRAAAGCHLGRAICRRAERLVWELAESADLNPALLQYLNRLSDYLFVAARCLARQAGGRETLWKHARDGSDRPTE